jgi:phage recombination protein Bet
MGEIQSTTVVDMREMMWTEEDKKLIRDTVAKGTSDSEFKLFLYTAAKYGLDPLVKQIWCVKYGNQPAAIFTGRDGFLSIAHRSGKFNGMETVALKDDKGNLVGARCTVWRKDMEHPFVVEVSLNEYNTHKGNWAKMPETMIKKVAESQCLRKAFDVSGIYAPEEYEPEKVNTQPVRKKIQKISPDTLLKDLPEEERNKIIDAFNKLDNADAIEIDPETMTYGEAKELYLRMKKEAEVGA